jgi:hypothetical protein
MKKLTRKGFTLFQFPFNKIKTPNYKRFFYYFDKIDKIDKIDRVEKKGNFL